MRTFRITAILSLALAALLSCGKNDEGHLPTWDDAFPPASKDDTLSYDRQVEQAPDDYVYPEAGPAEVYTPSFKARMYRPVSVKYNTGSCSPSNPGVITNWSVAKARIVHYMEGYETETKTDEKYQSLTNKWGSTLTMPKQEVTGRFYVKKIGGRWWIVDPDGYVHYMRGVTSFRQGSSTRNKAAFATRFGNDVNTWISVSREELAKTGIHATGAFCTGTYQPIWDYDNANPDKPISICPSFAFLSKFRSVKGREWPGGNADYEAGIVLWDDWPAWCKEYVKGPDFDPYRMNKYVFGFFSDNEIQFNATLLKLFLGIADNNDVAKKGAIAFMESKGLTPEASKVTTALGEEFAGELAERYYKGVRDAVNAHARGLMYVGSRLHGAPKYIRQVVQAAGRHCDIVSINYYSRWSPEVDTRILDWAEWSQNAPFMVTEFYTKGIEDSDLPNTSGAGFCVPTQADRAYAYQHFALGLLEARNCVGWTWFKYQDDDGNDNNGQPSNKGLYDNNYNMFPILGKFMREVNYNAYDLINYFDGKF